jgi:hypothetical protein
MRLADRVTALSRRQSSSSHKVGGWSSAPSHGARMGVIALDAGLLGFLLGFLPTQGPAPVALGTLTGSVTASPTGITAPPGSRLGFASLVGPDAVEVAVAYVGPGGSYRVVLPQGGYVGVIQLPGVRGAIPLQPAPIGAISGQQTTVDLSYSAAAGT